MWNIICKPLLGQLEKRLWLCIKAKAEWFVLNVSYTYMKIMALGLTLSTPALSSCLSNYLRLPLTMLPGLLISDKDLSLNTFLTSDISSLKIFQNWTWYCSILNPFPFKHKTVFTWSAIFVTTLSEACVYSCFNLKTTKCQNGLL